MCRRSGQWYELQNDFLTAFCYYHTAGDYDKMLTVFEKDRGCSFENNYKNKIMAYFGEAPETIRQKHIKAGLIYALWLFLSGENGTAAAGNQEAAEIYWAAGGQTGTGAVSGRAGVFAG